MAPTSSDRGLVHNRGAAAKTGDYEWSLSAVPRGAVKAGEAGGGLARAARAPRRVTRAAGRPQRVWVTGPAARGPTAGWPGVQGQSRQRCWGGWVARRLAPRVVVLALRGSPNQVVCAPVRQEQSQCAWQRTIHSFRVLRVGYRDRRLETTAQTVNRAQGRLRGGWAVAPLPADRWREPGGETHTADSDV